MKKLIGVFVTVALAATVIVACNKSSKSDSAMSTTHQVTTQNLVDGTCYPSMDEMLNYFDALYQPGDEITFSMNQSTGEVCITGTQPVPPPQFHKKETTNKYAFAKWCNDQLNAGNCLHAGKSGDTYWADIVPC